ncbi:hypothetical protein [Szabonella alba]|uniref:Uncharacterized protein n=1 Tax=Szabonella alba TaxID=2804194 RepID=A0A8K0XZI9_9RHOB|nr:hypothetical protein [Szabonella alba]MBL4915842.1 hypothetical protein [Szabonella alba]
MHDPNLIDFYDRVGRLQKAHASGQGFEALGTLGRSHYSRKERKRRSGLILPLLFVALAVFGLKATIHYNVGDQTYQDRVVMMRQGEGFDRLGAALMQADPVTLWLSDRLRDQMSSGAWWRRPQD